MSEKTVEPGNSSAAERAEPNRAAPRRRSRVDWSVLVALVSVAVALVYNAVQARDTARQIDTSRRALALSAENARLANLLDLHRTITDRDLKTTRAFEVFRAHPRSPLVAINLVEAVTPLEGIAYALNHQLTGIPQANGLWKRYLLCAFYTARAGVGTVLDGYVPELARYAHTQLRTVGTDRRCADVLLPGGGPPTSPSPTPQSR